METTAYTRFVLDCGQRGDVLDLIVALVPCVVGYAEIGARLGSDAATKRNGNPYLPWIEMYAGAEYQEVSEAARTQLDRLGVARGADARFAALAETFAQATRLEIDFWEMGWRVGAS
jgi:thiaminase/transcriptional activator TenA